MAMLNVLFYIASMTQRRRKTYSLLCYELVSSLFSFINVECSQGNYGINCLQKCGECRGKSPCNKINGSCPDGCSAGYIGSLCSEREYFYDIFSLFFCLAKISVTSLFRFIKYTTCSTESKSNKRVKIETLSDYPTLLIFMLTKKNTAITVTNYNVFVISDLMNIQCTLDISCNMANKSD